MTAKKRFGGAGYETIVGLITLMLCAVIYILLNWAMTGVDVFQNTVWISGYYLPDANTFLNTWWQWMPAIIAFLVILYLVVRYQRRSLDES